MSSHRVRILGALALTLTSLHAANATFAPLPASVLVRPDRIFSPIHFDDNDNAQFVFEATLISTCEKAGLFRAEVDPTALTITLDAREFIYSSAWCAQLESTYSGVVSLGVLPAGSYAIQAKLPDGSLLQVGVLPVAHARSANPDDFLYAPVESMHLEGGASSTRPILVLNGTYSNGCGRMKQVKLHRAPHLIEVLPIAEIRTSHCTSSPAVFEERVELGPVSAGDRVLIHVRSLNGQALNQVHQF